MKRAFPDWMEDLSWRAKKGLQLGGYKSRNEVILVTTAELLRVHGMGVKTVRELNAWRRPRTRTECESVVAWLKSNRAALSLTPEAIEIFNAVLLPDPEDKVSTHMRPGVLEILFPTVRRLV